MYFQEFCRIYFGFFFNLKTKQSDFLLVIIRREVKRRINKYSIAIFLINEKRNVFDYKLAVLIKYDVLLYNWKCGNEHFKVC